MIIFVLWYLFGLYFTVTGTLKRKDIYSSDVLWIMLRALLGPIAFFVEASTNKSSVLLKRDKK